MEIGLEKMKIDRIGHPKFFEETIQPWGRREAPAESEPPQIVSRAALNEPLVGKVQGNTARETPSEILFRQKIFEIEILIGVKGAEVIRQRKILKSGRKIDHEIQRQDVEVPRVVVTVEVDETAHRFLRVACQDRKRDDQNYDKAEEGSEQ